MEDDAKSAKSAGQFSVGVQGERTQKKYGSGRSEIIFEYSDFKMNLCPHLLGLLKISHQLLRRRLLICKREEKTNIAVRKSQHGQILLSKRYIKNTT